MSITSSHGRSRDTGCELFAALMKGERTISELVQVTGVARKNAELWVAAMRSAGLVYCRFAGPERNTRGRRPLVYCLQTAPFDREDWA